MTTNETSDGMTVEEGSAAHALLTAAGDPRRAETLNRFQHHPPSRPEVGAMHDAIRTMFTQVASSLLALPNSREMALALTHLETTMHWVNAAVAIHQIGQSPAGQES